jgi:peptide/nickel transport system permease protein
VTDLLPPATPSVGTVGSRTLVSRLMRRPLAAAALVIFALIVVACVAAPLIAPYAPNATDFGQSLVGPGSAHLLGTDELGRDTLSRLLYGGRPSLLYAAVVTGVAVLVGVPLGLLSGYLGHRTDRAIMAITDVGLAIPVVVVAIVVLSVFHSDFILAMIALGLLLVPPIVRNVRGPVLAIRRELFVDAAVVAGLTFRQIITRHILPRVIGPVLVQAALVAALALQFTIGLAYLGFGVQAPNPTWGSMIADGSQVLGRSSWLLLSSGVLVAVVILCLGVLGDTIRDVTVESWATQTPGHSSRSSTAAPQRTPSTTASGSALLSVSGLSIAFEQRGREVLGVSDVTFMIRAGETVGLVGESGCGKTSVARSIIRLLGGSGRVAAGDIRFAGRSILDLTGRELASYRGGSVSYISQEPMRALDPSFRVGKQIAEVLRAHSHTSRREARRRAIELLETARLPDGKAVARRYPHEISGGMAQRVAIARAIAARPSLLIADEPTTALDVTVQAEILALLRALQQETGMAILLVSHDWDVVSELCGRAMVMYAGEIVEEGSMDELLSAPAHPYTRGLLASRPSSRTDRTLPLPAIRGNVPLPGQWRRACRFADRCPLCAEPCMSGPVAIESIGMDRRSRCLRASEVLAAREELGAHD